MVWAAFDYGSYHSQSDSRSLSEFGNPRWAPSPNSALPPSFSIPRLALKLFRENPYLQVRLEFLRYHTSSPHFQRTWVRSSSAFYRTFNLDMGRSHGFGSTTTYSFALFRLAFAAAPSLRLNLACNRNSPVHSTKARHHSLTSFDLL